MKSRAFRFLKRKLMKSFIIIFLSINPIFNSFSNVLVIDRAIMEIYLDSGEWSIELYFEYIEGSTGNLENMRMTGLYDTAQFLPREYYEHEAFVVTQDDFDSPFYINPEGDWLFIEILIESEWYRLDEYGLSFGNIPEPPESGDYWVSAPVGEESVACQIFFHFIPPWYTENFWWTAKELPHSIGESPYEVWKRETISGYVKDKNGDPLAGINLSYCSSVFYSTSPSVPEIYTDSSGYFYTDNMFCKKYPISFLYNGGEIGDTMISVEPDSANYFEFKLDTLVTGIKENKPAGSGYAVNNIPNPSSHQTTFILESKNPLLNQKGVIKIYTEAGYIVDILPVEISGEKQELIYNFDDKSLASGIYFYNLEIGRAKMATGKMIISR